MICTDARKLYALVILDFLELDTECFKTLVLFFSPRELLLENSVVAFDAFNDFLVTSELGDNRPQMFEFDTVHGQSLFLILTRCLELVDFYASRGRSMPSRGNSGGYGCPTRL